MPTVRLLERHAEKDGTVCLLHNGGDRPQIASRDHAPGHQSILIQVFHVQSGTCTLHKWEYLSVHSLKSLQGLLQLRTIIVEHTTR